MTEKWLLDVGAYSENVILPLPISSYIHHPVTPIIKKASKLVKRLPNPEKEPPGPDSHLKMLDVIVKGSDEPNPYIQKQFHWGADLIACEPDPNLYDSYEDYLEALNNWQRQSQTKFRHPKDFVETIDVEVFERPKKPPVKKTVAKTEIVDVIKPIQTLSGSLPSPETLSKLLLDIQKPQERVFGIHPREELPRWQTVSVLHDLMSKGPEYDLREHNIQPLDQCVINSASIDIIDNLSPLQYWANLQSIRNLAEVGAASELRICFMLSQLHVCKDNRLRARMFLLLDELFKIRPSETISMLFLNDQTMSNCAALFVDFGKVKASIQIHKPYTRHSRVFMKLHTALFAYQLLSILLSYFRNDTTIKDVILDLFESYENIVKNQVNKQHKELENSFSDESESSTEAQVRIIHILMDFDPNLIDAIFQDQERTFFTWMGRLTVNENTSALFRRLCIHILGTPRLVEHFVMLYFANSCSCSSYAVLECMNGVAEFIGCLICSRQKRKFTVDWSQVNIALMNAIQIVQYWADNVSYLVYAICSFYMDQMEYGVSRYKSNFSEFRMSVVHLFVTGRLTEMQTSNMLRSVQQLLVPVSDKTEFMPTFLWMICGLMASTDETVAYSSWSIFRYWILTDPTVEKYISKNDPMKRMIHNNVQSCYVTQSCQIQLLLLLKGVVNEKGVRKVKRNRAVVKLFLGALTVNSIQQEEILENLQGLRASGELDEHLLPDLAFIEH